MMKKLLGQIALATSLTLGVVATTQASSTVDALSQCLVQATTATDKTTVLQWTFAALAQHPDFNSMSSVTTAQKEQLDKNLAQVLQRILVEQCSSQTKAVIQADGFEAVGTSFQELGTITGNEILKTPQVKNQLNGVLKHVDMGKLVTTFLTPDIWNKLGVIRGQ